MFSTGCLTVNNHTLVPRMAFPLDDSLGMYPLTDFSQLCNWEAVRTAHLLQDQRDHGNKHWKVT